MASKGTKQIRIGRVETVYEIMKVKIDAIEKMNDDSTSASYLSGMKSMLQTLVDYFPELVEEDLSQAPGPNE